MGRSDYNFQLLPVTTEEHAEGLTNKNRLKQNKTQIGRDDGKKRIKFKMTKKKLDWQGENGLCERERIESTND